MTCWSGASRIYEQASPRRGSRLSATSAANASVGGARGRISRAWETLRHYVRRVWVHSAEDDIFFLASGIAFGILLAAVPFVLLMISGLAAVLNWTPDVSSAEVRRLVDLLLPQHVEGPTEPLHKIADEVLRVDTAVGLWSAILFVWFSARLFGALRAALADVFDIEVERGMVAGKLFDLRLTVISTVLAIAFITINTYLALATSRGVRFLVDIGVRQDVMGGLEYALGRALSFAVILVAFYGLYRSLPPRRIHNRAALIGALVASLMFEVARYAFQWFTVSTGPATIYSGTLYAIVSVVFWVYYAAVIFLFGGEVARVHEIRLEAAERLERLTHEQPAATTVG